MEVALAKEAKRAFPLPADKKAVAEFGALLFLAHMIAARGFAMKELAISNESALQLAGSFFNVARHYGITMRRFSRLKDHLELIGALVLVYGPMIAAVHARRKAPPRSAQQPAQADPAAPYEAAVSAPATVTIDADPDPVE